MIRITRPHESLFRFNTHSVAVGCLSRWRWWSYQLMDDIDDQIVMLLEYAQYAQYADIDEVWESPIAPKPKRPWPDFQPWCPERLKKL
jgi:hypothetical protein